MTADNTEHGLVTYQEGIKNIVPQHDKCFNCGKDYVYDTHVIHYGTKTVWAL